MDAMDADTVENPAASADEAAAADGPGVVDEEQLDVAAMDVAVTLARFSAAPTNWHQATVYFLTAKAEEDAPMRAKAPLMYLAGMGLVIVQILSVLGLLGAMLHPSCTSNAHCDARTGFFCYTSPGDERGLCYMCGEATPLPQYASTERVPDEFIPPKDKEKESGFKTYNIITDQSYPDDLTSMSPGKRTRVPHYFGGYNFTMVKQACEVPVRPFSWKPERKSMIGQAPKGTVVVADRGDLPAWLPDSELQVRVFPYAFTAAGAGRWCSACVEPRGIDVGDGLTVTDDDTHLTVSIMNKRLLAMSNMDAMMALDWIALSLCALVVGLTVSGEIKDISLCEIAAQRNIKELSRPWQFALIVLNRTRAQVFLGVVMGAVPAVVLTRGGNALDVCFNTIAVLFITEVDNLAYQFGLSEIAKERVDTFAHVKLNEENAQMLSRTRVLVVVITVVGTIFLVTNGASVGAMGTGVLLAMLFKLSELVATYGRSSAQEVATFVATSFAFFVLSCVVFFSAVFSWYL